MNKKPITKVKLQKVKTAIQKAAKNKDKFDTTVYFKLPYHIKSDLQQYALQNETTVSDIIRHVLQSMEIKESKFDSYAVKELNRIGINVNQIARYINQANLSDEDVSLNDVYLKLEDIAIKLEKINKQIEGEK